MEKFFTVIGYLVGIVSTVAATVWILAECWRIIVVRLGLWKDFLQWLYETTYKRTHGEVP